MVVAARFAWLRNAIATGVNTRIMVAPAADPARCKIKVLVDPHNATMSAVNVRMQLLILDAVASVCDTRAVVDRGHQHTSNISEASFWFHDNAAGNGHRRDNGYGDGDDSDEDGDDDNSEGADDHRNHGESGLRQSGEGPCASAKNQKSAGEQDREQLSKRPRTQERHALEGNSTVNAKFEAVDKKIDMLLAGMALAVGPCFTQLMMEQPITFFKNGRPAEAETQPEVEMSPEKPEKHPASDGSVHRATAGKCMVFDMTKYDEPVEESAGVPTEIDMQLLGLDAALVIQRCYRGWLGRQAAQRQPFLQSIDSEDGSEEIVWLRN
mmetsp:Transcript_53050/g.102484  ORF Transcript_53050/g.102484 Transcript_53050/m.102484 type:complete len:324 (+) Transcript_53050:88-1059(+)